MRNEHYEFGRIRIDGLEQHADLLLTPTRVLPRWWRRGGHVLAIEDLDAVLGEPRRLVVGTGRSAACARNPASRRRLASDRHGDDADGPKPVRRINELLDLGDMDWTAALHLTC